MLRFAVFPNNVAHATFVRVSALYPRLLHIYGHSQSSRRTLYAVRRFSGPPPRLVPGRFVGFS